MKAAKFFTPAALARAPIVRESRLIRDLTMKERDWSDLDPPAWERLGRPNPFRERDELPMFLRRQAS